MSYAKELRIAQCDSFKTGGSWSRSRSRSRSRHWNTDSGVGVDSDENLIDSAALSWVLNKLFMKLEYLSYSQKPILRKMRTFLVWPDLGQLLTWGQIARRCVWEHPKQYDGLCCESLSQSGRKRRGGGRCTPHVRPRMAKRHVRDNPISGSGPFRTRIDIPWSNRSFIMYETNKLSPVVYGLGIRCVSVQGGGATPCQFATM